MPSLKPKSTRKPDQIPENQDRIHMEAAITQMRECIVTRSSDPKVGAVLVTSGQPQRVARRGQMNSGDHAEFTLLFKIATSIDLTRGGTLYTTLEPCTARKHTRKTCAQWIIDFGIKRVVIGILDPNREICGKGYWQLVNAGIEVDFFPSDLARIILSENKAFLDTHLASVKISTRFSELVRCLKHPELAHYTEFGLQECLSIQECPHKRDGWATTHIRVERIFKSPFVIPRKLKSQYNSYFKKVYEERGFRQDSEKFMLVKNPSANSDAAELDLKVRPTRYSHAMFYVDRIAKISTERDALIHDLLRGSLEAGFPQRFCLHMIVVTEDHQILITERAPKGAEEKNKWSASAEEQLALQDFKDGPTKVVLRWAKRLLSEELAISDAAYSPESIRILSVFLEAHNLNLALCGYVALKVKAEDLEKHLRTSPRFQSGATDQEYTDLAFLEFGKAALLKEIFSPTREWHYSSRYRLLYALLKNFGEPTEQDLSDYLLPR